MALLTLNISDDKRLVVSNTATRQRIGTVSKPAIIAEVVRKAGIRGDAKQDLYYGDHINVYLGTDEYDKLVAKLHLD